MSTIAIGLLLALVLGMAAQFLRLSPLVGYLAAGILATQGWWGVPVDREVVAHCSEVGVILLLFGVGLQFHIKDLVAVQKVAVPGALACIAVMVLAGTGVFYFLGMQPGLSHSVMYGLCICVSSTVVLTRVLGDNKLMSTPIGHTALGWLVVEDIFTILLLVLLPAVFGGGSLLMAFLGVVFKLLMLVACVAFLGRWVISPSLSFISRSGSNELFTLAVLVAAFGIAVLSDSAFSASTEFGAFLSGMVLGQSKFASRAAGDALPMRDAFAVLFFLSIGMGFELHGLLEYWPLALGTLAACMLAKPLGAFLVMRLLGRTVRLSAMVGGSLSQIGEFSFILAALVATRYHMLPEAAANVITGVAIISIVINAACYRFIPRLLFMLEKRGVGLPDPGDPSLIPAHSDDTERVVVVGYGPCGQIVTDILRRYRMQVVVLEMNIDTVERLVREGIPALHGDARLRSILSMAGIEKSAAIIISAPGSPAQEIAAAARSLNPKIRVLAHTAYIRNARNLLDSGAEAAFAGEAEAALSMSAHLLHNLGVNQEDVHREGNATRRRLLGLSPAAEEEE